MPRRSTCGWRGSSASSERIGARPVPAAAARRGRDDAPVLRPGAAASPTFSRAAPWSASISRWRRAEAFAMWPCWHRSSADAGVSRRRRRASIRPRPRTGRCCRPSATRRRAGADPDRARFERQSSGDRPALTVTFANGRRAAIAVRRLPGRGRARRSRSRRSGTRPAELPAEQLGAGRRTPSTSATPSPARFVDRRRAAGAAALSDRRLRLHPRQSGGEPARLRRPDRPVRQPRCCWRRRRPPAGRPAAAGAWRQPHCRPAATQSRRLPCGRVTVASRARAGRSGIPRSRR